MTFDTCIVFCPFSIWKEFPWRILPLTSGRVEIKKRMLSLIYALWVCYAARLDNRVKYYMELESVFKQKYLLMGGYVEMEKETK